MRGLLDDRAAPIAASMTWQARKPLDLQLKARSNAQDGETRVFCFAMESPENALDAGKHERTPLQG